MESDNKLVELLTDLKLAPADAATYVTLLQNNSLSIRKIAARTGINRGTTHEALKRLLVTGLVSVVQRGQREYYTAESPEKIYDLIRDKRRDLLDVSEAAKAIIPSILAKHTRPTGRPVVRYYDGDDGVATILKDVLETCRGLEDPLYYCYSSSRIRQYLYREFPQFTQRRIAAEIMVKVIGMSQGGEVAHKSERKWLSNSSSVDASSYTLIYGNKVAVISISSDLTPYGVVVEDPAAAAMQRLIFEQLWQYL
ncbi:MAG TPA: helix-turn-helix domain-containing protein [Patescibacteria group bacterium]|nr:helix-turn-helix domain-containing protein [Patescibacteria group bacterium]